MTSASAVQHVPSHDNAPTRPQRALTGRKKGGVDPDARPMTKVLWTELSVKTSIWKVHSDLGQEFLPGGDVLRRQVENKSVAHDMSSFTWEALLHKSPVSISFAHAMSTNKTRNSEIRLHTCLIGALPEGSTFHP